MPPTACTRTFAVVALDDASRERAADLSARLDLRLLDARAADWRALPAPVVLLVDVKGLSLGLTGKGGPSPVTVDFGAPELLHRLRGIGPRREEIARAVGLPSPRQLRIVDATAGWGRDSAVLAALGCEVTMLERHPVVAALLEDGMARAALAAVPEVLRFLPRLRLVHDDAIAWLADAREDPADVILLDPMFPDRDSSAAVRKEMVLFQHLVGDDDDASRLLEVALERAVHRVVVKRPAAAPPLAGRPADYSLKGRSTRFDVYALRRIA